MKFITIFAAFTLLTSTITSASETSTIEKIQDGKWGLYRVSNGEGAFEIRFPSSPEVIDSRHMTTYNSIDTTYLPGTLYGISFYRQSHVESEPYALFERVLQNYEIYPNTLISYEVFEADDNYILDICSGNIKNQVLKKTRYIVTSDNVYMLYTLFFNTENHDYFINSFHP